MIFSMQSILHELPFEVIVKSRRKKTSNCDRIPVHGGELLSSTMQSKYWARLTITLDSWAFEITFNSLTPFKQTFNKIKINFI